MLQNTRMRSGSFAAYVGTSQLIANGHNIRMQIQRLRTQACYYLAAQPDMPHWLSPEGRTWYFGGTVKRRDSVVQSNLRTKRQKFYDAGAQFGGDDGDDRFERPDSGPRFTFRRDILKRMLVTSSARRKVVAKALAENRPSPLNGISLARFVNYIADPTKFDSTFGATRLQALATAMHYLDSQNANTHTPSAFIANLQIASRAQDHPLCAGIDSSNQMGMDICNQLRDASYETRYGMNHKPSGDGGYLSIDDGSSIVELPTLEDSNGNRNYRCHKVYVDPKLLWKNLEGEEHRNPHKVAAVAKELNAIFGHKQHPRGIYARPEWTWQPHPEWKNVEDEG